jgi:hypothetical protein
MKGPYRKAKDETMSEIVVVIEGGAVQAVYGDAEAVAVTICDHDEYRARGMGWKEREARQAEVVEGLGGCPWGLDIPEHTLDP